MEIAEFERVSRDQNSWWETSKQHWLGARVMLEKRSECTPANLGPAWSDKWLVCSAPAHLLYGFAIETALKSMIVEHHPEKMRLTRKGSRSSDFMRLDWIDCDNGHDLRALAAAADLEADPEFLTIFTQEVTWSGKYPAPKRSDEQHRPDDFFAVAYAEALLTELLPLPLPPLSDSPKTSEEIVAMRTRRREDDTRHLKEAEELLAELRKKFGYES